MLRWRVARERRSWTISRVRSTVQCSVNLGNGASDALGVRLRDGGPMMKAQDRRIASPDWLPIGGRCLTVIVTGSNNLGGSDGEETQWIGTSGTDCGGSRSVFDQRAVCETGDSARVFGDHWLPPKV